MAFKPLAQIIPKTKKDPRYKRGLERVEIFEEARKIINNIAGFRSGVLSQDVKFELRGAVLTIKCANAYLAQELRFYQQQLKDRLNRNQSEILIREIKIKVSKY